jgi:heat-inducible transcriptional repressor
MAAQLGARRSAVLRAVVTDHIRTGEPVGSGALARRHPLGVSPATIRNEMARLEELGYLTHPHTSAGRIPTDVGYRFYVDSLPRRSEVAPKIRRAIVDLFQASPPDPDEAVLLASSLLSRLTGYGAVSQPVASEHVIVRGVANLAREAAFDRREVLERLFDALEEEETIVPFLRALAGQGAVVVRIGRENPLAAMRQASLVVAAYRVRGRPIGALGVVGPTRMQYPQAMSVVQEVAGHLSRSITALAG